MQSQISLGLDDIIIPKNELVLEGHTLTDRGSRYGYAFTFVDGKQSIKNFIKLVKMTKPFDSADHCSYAFRIKSTEGVLVEGKGDDGEIGAGQCILRELKMANIEQVILVVSRHFGGIYLQNDRYKNIVDVCRFAISCLIKSR